MPSIVITPEVEAFAILILALSGTYTFLASITDMLLDSCEIFLRSLRKRMPFSSDTLTRPRRMLC